MKDSDSVDLGWAKPQRLSWAGSGLGLGWVLSGLGFENVPTWTSEGIDHHLSEAARNLMSAHFKSGKGHSKIDFFSSPLCPLTQNGIPNVCPFVLRHMCRTCSCSPLL